MESPARKSRWPWYPAASLAVWFLICAAALVYLESFRAPRTFFFDEWEFLFVRRSGGVGAFLKPHEGHLSILPVAAYKAMFALFGMDRYRPYRFMGLLAHVLVATTVYRYVRLRLGDIAGIAAGALVLLLGSGWQNIFWPFQIGYLGSVAAAVIAWQALDRRSSTATIVASVALGVALACSGLGISIWVGTAARMAGERAWQRMVRVLAPSAVLYACWYFAYGEPQGSIDNLAKVPRFVVDSAANSFAGLAGRDLLWGRLLVGVLIGFGVAVALVSRRIAVAAVAPVATIVANWVLTAYARVGQVEPGASRYVYVGAVMLILVIADIARPFEYRWVRYTIAGCAVLGIWGNEWVLSAGAGGLRDTTALTRAELRALEWAPFADRTYQPDPQRMPWVTAGRYLDAAADLGSAAASDGEVEVADERTKHEVDRVSLEIMGVLSPEYLTAGLPAAHDPLGECQLVPVGADGRASVGYLIEPGDRVSIVAGEAAVDLRLRRYSPGFATAPTLVVAPGGTVSLVLGNDAAPIRSWSAELSSPAAFEVCR